MQNRLRPVGALRPLLYDCGITGALKVAHIAEGFGVDVEIHAAGPAQRHLMVACRNDNYYEMALVHPKVAYTKNQIYASDYRDGLDAIDSGGCVPLPEGDGLGVAYNWALIDRQRTGLRVFE